MYKIKTLNRIIFTTTLLLFTFLAIAQDNRYTESEISSQEKFIIANAHKLQGEFDKALEILEELKKEEPRNAAIFSELAKLNELLEKPTEGLEYAIKATELAPKNKWYLLQAAELAQSIHNNRKAAQFWSQLIKIEPYNRSFHIRQANQWLKANDVEKALAVYDNLESKIGFSEEIIRERHAIYLKQGDTKKAYSELEKLVNKEPNSIDYWELLASFSENIGDNKNANKAYKKILSLDANHPKAKAAMMKGNKEESGELVYLKSLEQNFSDGGISIDEKIKILLPYINKIAVNPSAELNESLLALGTVLTENHASEAKAFAIKGDIAHQIFDLETAKSAYIKTLELDKSVFSVWEQLLTVLSEMGDVKNALHYSTLGLDYFPSQARIFILNGKALRIAEKYNEANSILSEATFMTNRSPQLQQEVLTEKALLLANQNKENEAKKTINKALEIGKSVETQCAAARISAMFNDTAKGSALLKPLADTPFKNEKVFITTQAFIAHKNGDFQTSNTLLESCIQKFGALEAKNKMIYAENLEALGNTEAAKKEWKNLLDNYEFPSLRDSF